MKMPGPAPKPTALRILGGKAGHKALNRNEPKPPVGAAEPPAILSPEARREWDRVCGILVATGVLTLVDRAVLSLYCQAYGRWVQAENEIAATSKSDESMHGGLMVFSAKGNPIANPLIGVANVAMRDTLRYAVELGMTPSARSRIKATDAVAESDNPFMVLKNG